MTTPLPHSIFHASPAQRVALARERFFEEGVRPTGLVGEAIIQSWGRCLRGHRDTHAAVEFQPVSSSRAHHVLQMNRELVEAWNCELPRMHQALRSSTCAAMLTDAGGVVIAAMPTDRAHERLMPIAHRVGVNLSEEAVGTTAPGLVAATGLGALVVGAEHFFENVHAMRCAAAPVRDITGRLAGVIDISSEVAHFGFDAGTLVALYASALEDRLLISQSSDMLLLEMHVYPALLDGPVLGLAGVDAQGRLAWANGVAIRLLGTPVRAAATEAPKAEDVFGLPVGALASLPREEARLVALPNGLSIWMRARRPAHDGLRDLVAVPVPQATASTALSELSVKEGAHDTSHDASHDSQALRANPDPGGGVIPTPTSVSEAATLRAREKDLIARTLRECEGNVSEAAKRLRVSRGLIYRRLRT